MTAVAALTPMSCIITKIGRCVRMRYASYCATGIAIAVAIIIIAMICRSWISTIITGRITTVVVHVIGNGPYITANIAAIITSVWIFVICRSFFATKVTGTVACIVVLVRGYSRRSANVAACITGVAVGVCYSSRISTSIARGVARISVYVSLWRCRRSALGQRLFWWTLFGFS